MATDKEVIASVSFVHDWVRWAIEMVVKWSLLLLILTLATRYAFGYNVPMINGTSANDVFWLCGAWWLYSGGRLK